MSHEPNSNSSAMFIPAMADLMYFQNTRLVTKNTVNYFYVFYHREDRFLEKFSRKIDFALWLFQHKKKKH